VTDNDPENLAAARSRLADWADAVEAAGPDLRIVHEGRRILVRLLPTDLAGDLEPAVAGADLVAASALFDLASPRWIGDLARLLARRRLPLYASLTFTGGFGVRPRLPEDAVIAAAFAAHQRQDKGLAGVAAGPAAQTLLAAALRCTGAAVAEGDSSWHLGVTDRLAIRQVVEGFAAAAGETGLLGPEVTDAWLAARLRECRAVTVTHADLLATWSQDA